MPTPIDDLWQDTIAAWKSSNQTFHVYLVNGIKLQFVRVLSHDDRCFIALDQNDREQLVAFHAISTMIPGTAVPDSGHPRSRRTAGSHA